MVLPEGAVRCYGTVSLSQKLSLHRHTKPPILLHIFTRNQEVAILGNANLNTQIHPPVALSPPPQTQTGRAAKSNQVVPLGINPQDDDMLEIRLDRDNASEYSFRSLKRDLDRRLYPLIYGDAYGTPNGKRLWNLPEKVCNFGRDASQGSSG
ncbi:hypothetical protein Tco_0215564 [Tanacetum coccineum]